MDIRSCQVFVTEDELNELLAHQMPGELPLEDLRLQVREEGVVLRGRSAAQLFRVPFESLWTLTCAGSEVRASLARLGVAGLPASMLRGTLLRGLGLILADRPGLAIRQDTVVIDVAERARDEGVDLRVNLTAIHCHPGRLEILAGPLTE